MEGKKYINLSNKKKPSKKSTPLSSQTSSTNNNEKAENDIKLQYLFRENRVNISLLYYLITDIFIKFYMFINI